MGLVLLSSNAVSLHHFHKMLYRTSCMNLCVSFVSLYTWPQCHTYTCHTINVQWKDSSSTKGLLIATFTILTFYTLCHMQLAHAGIHLCENEWLCGICSGKLHKSMHTL